MREITTGGTRTDVKRDVKCCEHRKSCTNTDTLPRPQAFSQRSISQGRDKHMYWSALQIAKLPTEAKHDRTQTEGHPTIPLLVATLPPDAKITTKNMPKSRPSHRDRNQCTRQGPRFSQRCSLTRSFPTLSTLPILSQVVTSRQTLLRAPPHRRTSA